jgi:hypothetical protein
MPWPPVIPPATRANATPQLDAHPSDHNAISLALTDIVARVNPTAWTAIAFGTGWSNSGGQQPGQYRKIGDVVYLRGCVAVDNAATHGLLGTLPAGFRPPVNMIWSTWALGPTGGVVRLDVNSDGTMNLQGGLTGAIGYLSLNVLTFSVT